jgi:anaerobic selenocysteine-containing dehydrogenase
MEVDVLDGKPIAVRADASDPVFGGYSCIKGRQLVDAYDHETRITKPQKKMPDGSWKEISSEQALDEIAAKVKAIIEKDGPRAIASYCGTYAFQESAALAVSRAFHRGIGSDSYYTSVTIDQPGKAISMSRHGVWAGGPHSFEGADVTLIVGNNTVISQFAPYGGIPPFSPTKALNDALADGMKMIVIDPRRTEVAKKAHIHLQVRPAEDPTLLCGMIRVILDEELNDKEFCDQFVDGLDELRKSVDEYTPEYVEKRANVPAGLMIEAARIFANGNRGIASGGTGPNMSPHGNLTEHLMHTLNTLCGRYNREGDKVPNPGVLSPARNRTAEVMGPWSSYGEQFPKSRVRDLGQIFGEMPTAALNDEILLPGEGQVKALFSVGGNPIVAWPDQHKTKRAMDVLELLVCIDIKMSATAKLADYILPGKICLERDDVPVLSDTWFNAPYSHYAEAIVEPNGDLLEEWEFYWEVAKRIGSDLDVPASVTPGAMPTGENKLPMDHKPTKFEVLEHVTAGSKIPLADIRAQDGGHIFDELEFVVEPGTSDGKLQLTPVGIPEEIADIRAQDLNEEGRPAKDGSYTHLLISRRLKHVYNSSGQQYAAIRKKGTTNPAYLNPDDLTALGIESGDMVQITGPGGSVVGVTQATNDIAPGVCSMTHAWGDLPSNDGSVREIGTSTNRLMTNDIDFDPISGMPRQSAIPVTIRAITD